MERNSRRAAARPRKVRSFLRARGAWPVTGRTGPEAGLPFGQHWGKRISSVQLTRHGGVVPDCVWVRRGPNLVAKSREYERKFRRTVANIEADEVEYRAALNYLARIGWEPCGPS